ncbi:MAG: hypothetical protein ACRDSZ_05355 [Pseudonocardiaceae bacterium]
MTFWYLRSMADHDTHRGLMSGGSVDAVCGIRFTPRPVAFGGEALAGEPPDPDQICPQCLLAQGTR